MIRFLFPDNNYSKSTKMIVNVSVKQLKSLREIIIVKFFTIPICNGHIQLFLVARSAKASARTHAYILLSFARSLFLCGAVNRLSLAFSLSPSLSHTPSSPLSLIPIPPRLPLMFSSGDFHPSSGGYVSRLRHAISPATGPCLS